jgi:mannosylfructose-phosphate synthase
MISVHGYVGAHTEIGKPDTGGQVVFVIELAKRFARLGHRVDILTRRFENQPVADRINRSLRILRIPFGGQEFIPKEQMHEHLGDFVTNALAVINRKNLKYDVINSHYWDAGWSGQRIAEELGIPHIHTPHSLGWWKRKGMKGTREDLEKTYRFEDRIRREFLVYRNCDHVIATTAQQVAILGSSYGIPENHIDLIPPGIDEGRYTPVTPDAREAIRKRLGFREKDVYAVARAATNKGIDLLIEALPELRKLVPGARLVLAVGANSKRDERRVKAWKDLTRELDMDRHVTWLGYIEDDEMADHYRAASVFALPSRYEPFGMTAVEAMACGTPSVITIHGGLHEMVDYGTHALFADPKSPTELASALSIPLKYESVRDRLSQEGARFARRNFGWTGVAKRTMAVFDRYIGRYSPEEESPAMAG